MSNYTKTTNFAAKDTLPSGNAAKIVKGTEIDTEFNNIATAIATKADGTTAINTTTTFGGDVSGTYNAIVVADSDKVDGKHISTSQSGTDSNTIYFRVTL